MSFLNNLNWRFATKIFDTNKPVSDSDLAKILEAIRYTPSANGLQPYRIYVIKDQEFKKKLKPIANNQNQMDSSYCALIFCAIVGREEMLDRASKYIDAVAAVQKQKRSELINLETANQNGINKKNDDQLNVWAVRQTYIALGFALAACAELRIDSCPMEGFDRQKMDKALSLPKGYKSQAILTVGYRQSNPTRPKTRFSEDDLFSYL